MADTGLAAPPSATDKGSVWARGTALLVALGRAVVALGTDRLAARDRHPLAAGPAVPADYLSPMPPFLQVPIHQVTQELRNEPKPGIHPVKYARYRQNHNAGYGLGTQRERRQRP